MKQSSLICEMRFSCPAVPKNRILSPSETTDSVARLEYSLATTSMPPE